MAKVLINMTREPVYNKAGKLIGHLEHKDYVERPDPAPPSREAPPVSHPEAPRRVITMTPRELLRVMHRALVATAPQAPDVLEGVLRIQRERGQR